MSNQMRQGHEKMKKIAHEAKLKFEIDPALIKPEYSRIIRLIRQGDHEELKYVLIKSP